PDRAPGSRGRGRARSSDLLALEAGEERSARLGERHLDRVGLPAKAERDGVVAEAVAVAGVDHGAGRRRQPLDAAAQRPDARLHLLGLDPALLEGALDGVGEPLVAGQRLAGAGPAAIPVGGAVAGDGAQPGREGVGADAAAGLVEDREPDLLR